MKIVALVLLVTLAVVTAEVVKIADCEGISNDKCAVTEVRVDPCSYPEKCRIKKGKNTDISFDFTPQFSTSKLKTEVWYQNIKWDTLDSDACKATTCPTEAGKSQEFKHSLYIGKKLPSGTFDFLWKVFDEEDANNMCCFQLSIQLKR